MNQLTLFQNEEFGTLEVLIADGKEYFPATTCAKILGYANPQEAIRTHCKGVRKMLTPSNGGQQSQNYIPEYDLYRLIMRSKLPAAERFERFVVEDVLPSIRKHGAYMSDDVLEAALKSQDFAFELFKKLQDERSKSTALLGKVETLAPKAHYCDQILRCKNAVPVSLIARDYDMTAVAFNRLLHDLGIQFRVGTCWVLYKRFMHQGYTKSNTYYTPSGSGVISTCWTQKGRRFLYEALKWHGILPVMESLGDADFEEEAFQ